MKNVYVTPILGAILTLSFADNASAYLDPGTGSMLLQALIASIAGGFVMMHMYWGKLKSLLSSPMKGSNNPEKKSIRTENTSE